MTEYVIQTFVIPGLNVWRQFYHWLTDPTTDAGHAVTGRKIEALPRSQEPSETVKTFFMLIFFQ